NAIGAKLDKEILLAGNLEEFVEKCLLLLQKKRKLKSIGKAGRRFVEANYSWEKSHEQLEILLKKSVSISR
ncbi:MAG: glycosyltransferase, partial [Bacteroidota bacterium]